MPTLDDVLSIATALKRVCPMPQRWNELWEMLPNRKRVGGDWEPPAPLILGAWWHTSDAEKRERFRSHIQYASEHGVLSEAAAYLSSLQADQWHYENDGNA